MAARLMASCSASSAPETPSGLVRNAERILASVVIWYSPQMAKIFADEFLSASFREICGQGSFLKIQTVIYRACRVGDGSDRDVIYAGRGNGSDGFQIHAATRFGFGAAAYNLYRPTQCCRPHVVEEHDVSAGIRGLRDLLQSVGFDFDFQLGEFFSGAGDGGRDGIRHFPMQRDKMVVFDENHVEQTDAMVFPAAALHGVFFEAPP